MAYQFQYQPNDLIGGHLKVYRTLLGGMGEVYLCLDMRTNMPLALKTLQSRFFSDPKMRATFEREVATWIALEKHTNIVRCFALTEIENRPFMFLEWIVGEDGRGTSLRSWLLRGALDLQLALVFTIDICRGLIHANQKQPGIVHRDLKPDNILVDGSRIAKITDFGLAKVIESVGTSNTLTGNLFHTIGAGTAAYMAPEQWLGTALDQRTDIYAIGCILYELLTGQNAFIARTIDEMREKHLLGSLPKLSDNAAINALLGGCLAKSIAHRIPNAELLLTELNKIYEANFNESPPERPSFDGFTASDYANRGATLSKLRRFEAAISDYTQAIEFDPTDANVYCNRGTTYYLMGNTDAAASDFDKALKLNPKFSRVYSNRSNLQRNLGNHQAALADCNHAVELDPQNAAAYENRAVSYTFLGRFQEALEDCNKAIELDSNFARAYFDRGVAKEHLGALDQAIVDYNRAIELDPLLIDAYGKRGEAFYNRQEYSKALADYSRILSIDSNNAQAFVMRGVTYTALKQFERALVDYKQALNLEPNNPILYHNLGVFFHKRGDLGQALIYFEKSSKLGNELATPHIERIRITFGLPKDERLSAEDYFNRGLHHLEGRSYEEALRDFKYTLQLNPIDAAAAYEVGKILAYQGNLRDAMAYLGKAAQLGHVTASEDLLQVKKALGM